MTIIIGQSGGFRFWDVVGGSDLGYHVGDAFEEAGGSVYYEDACTVRVSGLSHADANKIAKDYQADYLGPVTQKHWVSGYECCIL